RQHGDWGISVESLSNHRPMDVVRKAPQHGWIEVVTGSMFSGKSEELIRRLRRAQIARQRVQIFKPRMDDRFSEDHIVSHSDMKIKSQLVLQPREILEMLDGRTQEIGVDEGQSFDMDLLYVRNKIA